jgi:hypothetical protein
MPVPTPDDLGSLPRVPGTRPVGGYDLGAFASGGQKIAEAGARLGESVANAGKAAWQAGREQATTEAVNANAFIHARLIEARERYRNDPDHATLAQRWGDESGKIVDDGLAQISDPGLREHVRAGLAVPLAQENAAIRNQAFRGAASAHAASRDRYLQNLIAHASMDSDDSLFAGGVNSLHGAIDDAVARGFLTPEQAADEKRRAALALVGGEYDRMSRADPERAIRELETPGQGHPLLAQLRPEVKAALIHNAREQQAIAARDADHAMLRRAQESRRASDEAENAAVDDLTGDRPTLTRTAIAAHPALTGAAKAHLFAIADRTAVPDPDETSSAVAARGLLDRIRLPDGDPSRIAAAGDLYDAYAAGKLNRDDFNFVRREFRARQTSADASLLAHKQAFLRNVALVFDQSDPLIGDVDRAGRAKMFLLERDLDRRIGQYMKAGKDPLDLFDPGKPDFAGALESLSRYRPTARDSLELAQSRPPPAAFADAAGSQQAPPQTAPQTPPRIPGETPADYLKRIGAPVPLGRPRVPMSK